MSRPDATIDRDCPECQQVTPMWYDAWEDYYHCTVCDGWFYPEDLGLATDRSAGIFHIGEKKDGQTSN
jgi:hypothetical protein